MSREENIPGVSVVVLSWMRREELKRTLGELRDVTYPILEIIVADNGSTDGSREMVAREFPGVKLIALPENLGIEGLNAGMRAASGKYIVLLDDDSHLARDAIGIMVERFEAESDLGILAFTIVNGTTGLVDWPQEHDLHPSGQAPTFVGCGVGLRAEAVRRAGYFDPGYFLYLNELYLTARILDLGYTCRHARELRAYHRVAQTHRTSTRRIYYTTRNIFRFVRVHLHPLRALGFIVSWTGQGILYQSLRGGRDGLRAFVEGARAGLGPLRATRRPLSGTTLDSLAPYFRKWYPSPLAALRRILAREGG